MQKKFWQVCGVIIICQLLLSCTSRSLYNNLDWLSGWYVDDYVTLTDAQETELDAVLESFMSWHRRSELPRYRAQLIQVKAKLNQGVDESYVEQKINALSGFWREMVIKASPDLVRLASSLTPEQVDEWLMALEERNLEEEQKLAKTSKQDRLGERQRRIESQLKKMIGKLSVSQKTLVRELVADLQPTTEDWLIYRRNWAGAVKEAYTKQRNTREFEQLMMARITQTASWRTPAYQQKLDDNQRVWVQVVPRLLLSLTQKQKDKLNDEIDGVLHDIDTLISQQSLN